MKQLLKKSYMLVLIAGLALGISEAQAQSSCSQKLQDAQRLYDDGKVEQVVGLVKSCLKSFNREEKITAYKLLTLTYLYLNEKGSAIEYMSKFLQLYPDYEINESIDTQEFIQLYDQFRTYPVFYYGIKGGVNYSLPIVLRYNGLGDDNGKDGEYKSKVGFQLGGTFDIPISKKLSLNPEFMIYQKNIWYSSSILKSTLNEADNNIGVTSEMDETQLGIQIPLLAKMEFGKGKIIPFLMGGATLDFLLRANGDIKREDNDGSVTQEIAEGVVVLTDQRTFFNYSATLGIGARVKKFILERGNLIVDLRYNFALNSTVKKDSYGDNLDRIYKYGLIDNQFTLSTITLNLGYVFPYYNPKLQKK